MDMYWYARSATAGIIACPTRHIPNQYDDERVILSGNTRYAVGSNLGMCLNKRPDSPPAGRKTPFFCTNMLHTVQHVCAKDQNVPCCRR